MVAPSSHFLSILAFQANNGPERQNFEQVKKVYCIGELLIDFVAEKQGNDLSKATEFTKKAGGAPANVACAISKLGGQSAFVGCVGHDPFGSFLVDVLQEHLVDTTLVQRSNTFTTLAFVSLAGDGERDFVFSRGADRELKYGPELKNGLKQNIIHFGAATALLGGPLEEAYKHYFFDALSQSAFISFDPNYRGDLWRGNEAEFVKKCLPFVEKSDLCKFSLEEAQLLSGKEDLQGACETLHQMGARAMTITLGEKGTFVSTSLTQKIVPTIEVVPVDTTGAGDAFMGCLLQQLSLSDNTSLIWKDAELLPSLVKIANKAGAITTTDYGAITALPTAEQLRRA